ncbi:hypothetical protein PsorP6_003657 [Peronosclerospora sorghi]|uniref:Uncharacterized protein n=1 Tax=Peronosclerospora sorghi TaxID=230839 RepID=A0ACC0VQ61_9STRA|nr:hypothetical protein PsorP6_003657 [Peronosclerospora sorghi]
MKAAAEIARALIDYDLITKAFFAPEILISEPSRSSSDMYACGLLLAQLDQQMKSSELVEKRMQSGDRHVDNNSTLLSPDGTIESTDTAKTELDISVRRTTTRQAQIAFEHYQTPLHSL